MTLWAAALLLPVLVFSAGQKKALSVQDIMKFREIHNPVISEDGKWIAYEAKPDRGDGEVTIHAAQGRTVYTIERGSKPVISRDSRWVAAAVLPAAAETEKSKKDKDKPKQGMALLNTETGDVVSFENVESFAFAVDAKWLVIRHFKNEGKKQAKPEASERGDFDAAASGGGGSKKHAGNEVALIRLETMAEKRIPFVHAFAIDSTSHYFAYSVVDTSGRENGIYSIDLYDDALPKTIVDFRFNGYYTYLTWNHRRVHLAYLTSILDEGGNPDSTSMWVWDPGREAFVGGIESEGVPEGWVIHSKNALEWTRDGRRLFFGLKPVSEIDEEEKEEEDEDEEADLFDIETILEGRGVDVWHWNDPTINSNQKKMWPRIKDRTYRTVYHLDEDRLVRLADESMPEVSVVQNPRLTLGSSDVAYRKLTTWDGGYRDYYVVNLFDGSRGEVVMKLRDRAYLSPQGRYVVYYQDCHWFLYDCSTGKKRNLTVELDNPFYDEDHDYPQPAPGYGLAGWLENDAAVLIYDKYDIWQFSTSTGQAVNLTGGYGRANAYTFRIRRLDRTRQFFRAGERLMLTAHHQIKKHTGFYTCVLGTSGVQKGVEEEGKTYNLIADAKHADRLLYTRESYTEFPDVWVCDSEFRGRRKLSDVNPQVEAFAWGSAELVEWESVDGIPLQGVLIKPGNYEKGKRYPVLVYFYRFFSQRVHQFNQVVINHRPCFPFYASNGYAVFLPDIRFEVGRPGFSATKCIVPGVQKLVDMGVADPDAVALHGHSWSGYQTAFVVTQSDIFCCAIAGAPVSNMTSAYSGIRWGSGMARQFQYEQSQSRIGGHLWNNLPRYIENSPVFYADRINTPMLLMFGDEDGAVPWYQGIELYLAMRRLEKDCIFLQYRGEPHHPQKYANKLDYTLKMREYLDHHCKDAPAPDWMTKGVPYRGK